MEKEVKDIEGIGLVEIGRQLKVLRIEAGYTNARSFVDETDVNVSINTYHAMENGKISYRTDFLFRVLNTHKIGIKKFFEQVKIKNQITKKTK